MLRLWLWATGVVVFILWEIFLLFGLYITRKFSLNFALALLGCPYAAFKSFNYYREEYRSGGSITTTPDETSHQSLH